MTAGSVLDRIVAAKLNEVAVLRRRASGIRDAALTARAGPDFTAALTAGAEVSVIGEVKRRSPSAGAIRAGASAEATAAVYAGAGVSAISVLTDREHFGGDLADLEAVRSAVSLPLLRKDFTIDALQILEAKAAGASAVLLIVRILDDAQLSDFGAVAAELGLSALVEVHDEAELERAVGCGARLIGINNRDLATFTTDLETTVRLARVAPADCVLVGESGIRTAADVQRLADAGVAAVLVGEALMRAADPAALARRLASVPRRAA